METENQHAAGSPQPAETGVAPALASNPELNRRKHPTAACDWIFIGQPGFARRLVGADLCGSLSSS